jgi:hypothetical protein
LLARFVAQKLGSRRRCAMKPANIRTWFEYPPIPIRSFDWGAMVDDGSCDCPECHPPIGWGTTEQEAVADLMEQIEEGA